MGRIVKVLKSMITPVIHNIEPEFIDWEDYKNKINFLDEHNFRQKTRRETIRNLTLFGEVLEEEDGPI